MIVDVTLLAIGLVVLVAGGEVLVRSATRLAVRIGVSSVVIGLTVVAFGTSAPELVVNVSAALRGETSIGFGNVVGSNMANIGLLLAATAVIYPLTVERSVVSREIPMMLIASAAAIALGLDSLFGGDGNHFSRGDGLVLLLLFGIFLYYTINDARQQRSSGQFAVAADDDGRQHAKSLWQTAMLIPAGLLLLVAGAELTVRSAVGLATDLGVPEVVVGLSIVAVGTSLPELTTTFIAARRGQTDLAVGNIVGSNIFNLLFIWGITTTMSPTDVPAGGDADLMIMTGFAAVLFPMALSQRRLSRTEGSVLLGMYAAYMVWLVMR